MRICRKAQGKVGFENSSAKWLSAHALKASVLADEEKKK
jgi:hypothetical protein